MIAVPTSTANAAATAPTTNDTAATTTAFAASTRPRRGLAANVTRISERRYSAVMNSAATTPRAISPANVPRRYSLTVIAESAPPPCPAGIGAMSPDPVTLNPPPAWW